MENSFKIILHAGNARSLSMEAIALAKETKYFEAREKIAIAKEELNKAHHEQTALIQGEARGEKTDLSVILIHAQDHLMTAMVVKDLANEFIELYENI